MQGQHFVSGRRKMVRDLLVDLLNVSGVSSAGTGVMARGVHLVHVLLFEVLFICIHLTRTDYC